MNRLVKIKKGLDIKLAGSAPKPHSLQEVEWAWPAVVAVTPDDFAGFTPKVAVKEGESVKAGAPLLFDKLHPEVKLVSPVDGVVRAVVRGDRRKVLRVEVTPTGSAAGKASIDEAPDFKTLLMRSGLWCMMRQRPYDIVPNPEKQPRDIFVTAFDSSPLAPHLEFQVEGKAQQLAAGVKALQQLTSGKVYVGVPADTPIADIPGAEMLTVDGPHPCGNAGVQIAAVSPVSKGETVWTLDVVTLAKIGELATDGAYTPDVLITVAGPEVQLPHYVRTVYGADAATLLKGVIAHDEVHRRVIAGSVLSGVKIDPAADFLRAPYRQLSVIREGDDADEFMGWANPEAGKPSVKRSVLGHFLRGKLFSPDARLNGGRRAMILSGEYDRVLPMDIMAEYLLKAILSRDIDKMEALGIYEVAPEDFALAEFVDTSKLELQKIVREGLDYLRQEVE